MWGDIAIAFAIAFLTTFMATPYTIKLAKKLGAVDTPSDERRINKITMTRLGGLAVILGFVISVIYLLVTMSFERKFDLTTDNYHIKLIGFAVGGLIICGTCFIDDVKGVPAIIKLFAQIVAACIVAKCGIKIESISLPFEVKFIDNVVANQIFYKILTVGWIIGITNAINLIDGLDGLSTGISLISCISLMIIFSLNGSPLISIILITALAGALVGFLPFNFNPARTFIGDTGSNFLGFSIAVISIMGVAKTYTAIVVMAPIIVLALPIFDTLFAIIRRIVKGKSFKAVLMPDKGHLHHRLIAKGYTHKQAVLILYGISATFGMFAIILLESGWWKAISFALLVIAIVALGYKEAFGMKKIEEENKIEENPKTNEGEK